MARNKIGRLKLMLERDLGDEWFLITGISAPQKKQLSTGMAAVIHYSRARCLTTVELACPEGSDKCVVPDSKNLSSVVGPADGVTDPMAPGDLKL